MVRHPHGRSESHRPHPDGARAVSASDDKTLRVWDLAAAREIAVLCCSSALTRVAVDSQWNIIAAGASGLWHREAQIFGCWQLAWHTRLMPQGNLHFDRNGMTVRTYEPIYTERINGQLVPSDPCIDACLLLWDGKRVRRPYEFPDIIDWPAEKHPTSFALPWPDSMREWAPAHYGGHQQPINT